MSFSWLKFREFFNASNYFLVFLVVLTAVNIFLHFQIDTTRQVHNKTVEVLVLDQEREFFGGIYWLVWYENSVWKLVDMEFFYQIGETYKIQAELTPFRIDTEDSKIKFYINNGIAGQIQAEERFAKSKGCNFFCRFLKWVNRLRYRSRLKLTNLACNNYKNFAETLAPNLACQDLAGLSIGLTMGGTRDFQNETRQAFRQMGLMHLVAISGLQVVLVISFVEVLFLFLRIPKGYRIMGMLSFLFLLLVLAGPRPPILRSGLSVILSLFSLNILGRKLGGLRALSYAGLILLWLNPNYLFSFSFLMSFVASLGLRLFRFGLEFKNFVAIQAWEIFQKTLAAILFVLPLVINLSGFISVSSLITNFLILPFIPFITILNFLSLMPLVGEYFYFLVVLIQSQLLVFILDLADKAVVLELSTFSGLEMFFYYATLIFLVEFFRRRFEFKKLVLKKTEL